MKSIYLFLLYLSLGHAFDPFLKSASNRQVSTTYLLSQFEFKYNELSILIRTLTGAFVN